MKYFKHIDYVNPGELLPGAPISGTFNFFEKDSEEIYKENLKKKGSKWYYANRTITYRFNKNGYRAPEWNEIDWENSVVIFGGSDVFGVGLDQDDTVSGHLSRLLNRPVVNLGVSGSGIIFSAQNALLLHNQFPTPWAVVNIWAIPTRMHVFEKHRVAFHGPWSIEKGNFADKWLEHFTNPELHCYLTANLSKQLWLSKTRYYETTWWAETSYIMGCKYLSKKESDARDLAHYGIETMRIAAEHIAENLN